MFTDYFSAAVSVPVPSDGDRVLTVDELARQFQRIEENHFPMVPTGVDRSAVPAGTAAGKSAFSRVPWIASRPTTRSGFAAEPGSAG